jgi:hypothetical protein
MEVCLSRRGQTWPDDRLSAHGASRCRGALKFLKKAIRRNGLPKTITIDGSTANEAAIKRYNADHGTAITIRQVQYLNNRVEQDHRGVKRVIGPMLGFKSFVAAQSILVGIELMRMLRKRQLTERREQGLTAAEQFYRNFHGSPLRWSLPDSLGTARPHQGRGHAGLAASYARA